MDKQYIIPVVGQIYRSRSGGEYRSAIRFI